MVDLAGGSGGNSFRSNVTNPNAVGGYGGRVVATLQVDGLNSRLLWVNVGGFGGNGVYGVGGAGSFSGGGYGNNAVTTGSGGGGGASDIRTIADDLNTRLVVAGGGGGAGAYFGGVGPEEATQDKRVVLKCRQ